MPSRLPVVETSKSRIAVKVFQIVSKFFIWYSLTSFCVKFLVIPVIVSIRSFKSTTSIKVICGPELATLNVTYPLTSEVPLEQSEDSNITISKPSFETFLNYTIQFPFKSPRVFEPFSCNESNRVIEQHVYPSMRIPAMVLTITASVSSMYCFMFVYAYLNFSSFSKPQVICEVVTSIFLSFFWFLTSVSWSSSVAHIKHFGTYYMYYSHLCGDPMSSCTKSVSGSSYCSLYISLIFCFINFLIWFTVTCLRIHSTAFLLFPSYFTTTTTQAKFSRIKNIDRSFHSLNNSQSIATIEDKIEFQRDDFFQDNKQFVSAKGSINNPNYDPDDALDKN